MSKLIPLATALLFFSSSVLAQPASVYVDIGPCMAMADDANRYACYDLLEEQIRASQEREIALPVMTLQRNTRDNQPSVNVENETQVNNDADGIRAQASDVADFGRESPGTTRGREINARVLSTEAGEQELVDTILSLEERLPKQWEVTLESGQVWQQINSKTYRLRKGMEVRVYPSPFGGSFRMSASNLNGFIQVRRIQ